MERQEVWRKLIDISLYDLEGTVDNAIDIFKSLKEQYKDKKIELVVEYNYDYTEGLILKYKDIENDEEYNERIGLVSCTEKEERQQLVELKKKYE